RSSLYSDCRDLPAFPTRRSSDLAGLAALMAPPDGGAQTAADEAYVEPLLYQALETEKSGVEVPWSNPATGSSGTIVIERTFYRRSEEHTSELQSRENLVCRLLLE